MNVNEIVESRNKFLFSASWGGYGIVPSTCYVYESDEFTGRCITIIFEGGDVKEKSFMQSDDAIAFVAQLMKLKASPVKVDDFLPDYEE